MSRNVRLIVDRIENDFAVCEREDGGFVSVPLALLPDVAGGAHYRLRGGQLRRNRAGERAARRRNAALQRQLFQKK